VCTLIAGLEVLGPGTLLLGANRDESPERATAGPGVLVERPRVVGGRDLVSGGTWLAVREARFISALMNRRPIPGDTRDPSALRSRGLLCLDAAATGPPLDAPAAIDPGTGEPHPPRLDAALRLLHGGDYAHCTLVGIGLDAGWAIHAGHRPAAAPTVAPITAGWHVITHRELDDPDEPRTHWLMQRLQGARPKNVDEAFALLGSLLRGHGEGGEPPVCLHRDRFPTVSSSLLALGVDTPLYHHAPGPPCFTAYEDFSALLG
jgi:transport and Golgi organization protein 2